MTIQPADGTYYDGSHWRSANGYTWDGQQWLAPVQAPVVIINQRPVKSAGVAFLLAFLFGPLGLLYASVAAGLVLLLVAIVLGVATGGIGAIIVWPISFIMAPLLAK